MSHRGVFVCDECGKEARSSKGWIYFGPLQAEIANGATVRVLAAEHYERFRSFCSASCFETAAHKMIKAVLPGVAELRAPLDCES